LQKISEKFHKNDMFLCTAQAINTREKSLMGNRAFARKHGLAHGLARVATNLRIRCVKRRGSFAIHVQNVNACHRCFPSWLSGCRVGRDGALPAQLPGLALRTGWRESKLPEKLLSTVISIINR
jgi:hypothetical protein